MEAERRLQEEEDARLLRALTAQEELPGECRSATCSEASEATCIQPDAHFMASGASHAQSQATHHTALMRKRLHYAWTSDLSLQSAKPSFVQVCKASLPWLLLPSLIPCLQCAEVMTPTAEEEGAHSSEGETSVTPASSAVALTALSGAISEPESSRAAYADIKASLRTAGRAGSSIADDEQPPSEAVDWQANAAAGVKKKRNRKQRYRDNLVSLSRPVYTLPEDAPRPDKHRFASLM